MIKDQFEKLAQLIQGAHEELSGEIRSVRTDMNARFDKVDNEFAHIRAELKDIRGQLDVLEKKVGEHSGYTKEIDHLLSRIVVIEQRLGIVQTTAD